MGVRAKFVHGPRNLSKTPSLVNVYMPFFPKELANGYQYSDSRKILRYIRVILGKFDGAFFVEIK